MAEAVGFFTDTTVCIGCKACEVACHQWNALPAAQRRAGPLSGAQLRQHRRALGRRLAARQVHRAVQRRPAQARWLMMSDVCKHCVNAPCLEVCPTGAIVRTEFDTVYIQEPVCNGCRDCIAACPFGVIHVSAREAHRPEVHLLLRPAPERPGARPAPRPARRESIQFGPIDELRSGPSAGSSSCTARGRPRRISTAPTTRSSAA